MFEVCEVQLLRQRPGPKHPVASDREELYLLMELDGTHSSRKQVRLSQGLECGLDISVKLFHPQKGDKTTRVVRLNETNHHVPLPPYCLSSIRETRNSLRHYIQSSHQKYLDYVVKKSDPVTQLILEKAIAFQSKTKSLLVHAALEILALCRMIELSWGISGEESLGIREALASRLGENGLPQLPITPMMSVQLDQIVIRYFLNPLAEAFLSELQDSYNRRKGSEFELFLTQYILSTHYEVLLRHARRNAIKYDIPSRYSNMTQAKAFLRGHNILMAHFHHYKKHLPFKQESHGSYHEKTENMTMDQTSIIHHAKSKMMSLGAKELRGKKHYEQIWYFTHQIFDDTDWYPEDEIVAELNYGY